MRLCAFGDAMHDLLEDFAPLALDAERHVPGARFMAGPYGAYRAHVALLLREALGEQVPREYLADALMAPLSAEAFLHHRRARETPLAELKAAWHRLATGVLRCPASAG